MVENSRNLTSNVGTKILEFTGKSWIYSFREPEKT